MRSKTLLGVIYLVIAAFFWGSTFVAQEAATVGPFTYLAMRSYVGALFLTPVIWVADRVKKPGPAPKTSKTLWVGGAVCGVLLFFASSLQQIGIDMGTDAGKAGFLTSLYILLVPILGLFFRKRVAPHHWPCCVMALAGLFLLCLAGDVTEFSFSALLSAETLRALRFQVCDLVVLGCALGYSFHILAVDRFAPRVDGIRLSRLQFFVAALIATVAALLFERPDPAAILANWGPILYAGVLSSGVAYTLQILSQKLLRPTVAAMLMGLESAFAVVSAVAFGFLTGDPRLPTPFEWLGCGLMLAAITLAQLPEKKKAENNSCQTEKTVV